MIESLITATLIGLAAWIFKQNGKILLLESKLEDLSNRVVQEKIENDNLRGLAYSMDAKIDKRISESNAQLKELLVELKLTLSELNTTVRFLNKEVEELKHRK